MQTRGLRVNAVATPSTPGRRYGGVDSDVRLRQRRDKLIKAALAVFGAQGFHASVVRDICHEAELTSRYFYESFDSMEALFLVLYEDVSGELMQRTVSALAQAMPEREKLVEAALRTFFEFIKEDPRRARVALIDALTVSPAAAALTRKVTKDFARLIADMMQQLLPGVDRAGFDLNMVAEGLIGAVYSIGADWAANLCRTPIEGVLGSAAFIFNATSRAWDSASASVQA